MIVVMFSASVHACTLSCMHVCIHMHVCMCVCVFVYVHTMAIHVIAFGCVSVMMCVCVCVFDPGASDALVLLLISKESK